MAYDVVMETWFSSQEDFRREVLQSEAKLRDAAARYISYRVTPRLHKDPRSAEAGTKGARPKRTAIFSFKWLSEVSRAEAERHWNEHAAVVLRQQSRVTKYEQNVIDEIISWSADVIAIDSYADFTLSAPEVLTATEEEKQDVAKFIGQRHAAYLGDVIPFV